jgi:hypothetical protein
VEGGCVAKLGRLLIDWDIIQYLHLLFFVLRNIYVSLFKMFASEVFFMKLKVAFSKCKCKSTLFVRNGNWIVYTNLTALIDWKSFRSWWQPCGPLSVSSSQQVSSTHSLWRSGELTSHINSNIFGGSFR